MPISKGNFQNYVCLVKIQFRKLFYGITYPNSDRERFTEEKKGGSLMKGKGVRQGLKEY